MAININESRKTRVPAPSKSRLCKHASLPDSRIIACNVDSRDIINKRGGRQKFFSYVRGQHIHAPYTEMGKSSHDKNIMFGSETAYLGVHLLECRYARHDNVYSCADYISSQGTRLYSERQ